METAIASYRRLRRLVAERSGPYLAAAVLAVLDALLCLSLLVVGGLLADLLVSRGVTHLPESRPAPAWLASRVPATRTSDVWVPDTGLTGLIADNRGPDSPWLHRVGVGLLSGVVARVPALQTNRGALFALLVVTLVLLVLLLLLYIARGRIMTRLGVEAGSSLRRQIHRQLYRLGQSALPNQGVGPVLDLFTYEVNDVRQALADDVDRTVRLPVLAVGAGLVALAVSWPLTVFFGALIGVAVLAARPFLRSRDASARDAAGAAGDQLLLLHEDLGLVRTVRVYGMEAIDKDRFDEHLGEFEEADLRRMRSEHAVRPSIVLVVGGAVALAMAVIGLIVLAAESERLSLAGVLTVGVALFTMARTVREWVRLRDAMTTAGRSAQSIGEYLDRRPELTMGVGARFLAPLKDRILFEHVGVDDKVGRPLLSAVSAEIKAGSRVAVMGLDEEACLALVCLVPRLLDPSIGRVRIDGHDLRDVTLESLRAQVGTVLQSDLVFSDTVTANIALGDPSFSLPRVVQAAKLAHAHHFIQNLQDGYDTPIGPLAAVQLSRDEQFRIALARAILHDPSILIIEEPTTPIDDTIKPLIDDTIDRIALGRTLIFLPGRLSTVRKCDQVIVLQNGTVAASGSPRQLMKENQLFRHLQYVNFHKFATGEVEVGQMEG
jgi:ABC-type multidrug transport system fused ATPase/permease subunit